MFRNNMPVVCQCHMRRETSARAQAPAPHGFAKLLTKGSELAGAISTGQHVGTSAGITHRTIKHHVKRIERIERQRVSSVYSGVDQILL
jgi:hypothetical protein